MVCPDCNWHSVLDPAWLGVESLKEECDNCMDGEQKEHKVKAFTAENLDELPQGPFPEKAALEARVKELEDEVEAYAEAEAGESL